MNKQRRLAILLWMLPCLLMAVTLLAARTTPSKPQPGYHEQWEKVTSFVEMDRPQSALDIVMLIEQQAIKEKNTIQRIKARMMTVQLVIQKDPEQLPAQLAELESLTATTTDVQSKALLQSLSAQLYQVIYYQNRYTINQRTDIVGQASDDVTQWSKNNFADTITNLLALSLQPVEHLKATPLANFLPLLTDGNSLDLEPTLFDLLARRRVENLINLRNAQRDNNFDLDLLPFFDSAERFIQQPLDTTVISRVEADIIHTFQIWLQVRLQAGQSNALLHADLYRLNTLKTFINSTMYWRTPSTPLMAAEEAYLSALQALAARYANDEHVLTVLDAEAAFYESVHRDEDSLFCQYKHKAYTRCAEGLAMYPQAPYSNNLRNRQAGITQQRINITQNTVTRRNSPLLLNVSAANIHQALLTVYRLDLPPKTFVEQSRKTPDPATFNEATRLEQRTVALETDSLFIPATTIVSLKGQDYGQYGFSLRSLADTSVVVHGYYVVSDLAGMVKSYQQAHVYMVDRFSGKPQPNVSVQVCPTTYNKGRFIMLTRTVSGNTNQQGNFAYTTPEQNANHVLFFERGKDRYLHAENYHYTTTREQTYEREDKYLTLLTDRALYRPGQTIHVKGIAYQLNNDVHRVLPNKTYEVELLRNNMEPIAKQRFKTNEFGSFSGTFLLPEDGLNGRYFLRNDNSIRAIWVESYKRPSFEVTLDKPEAILRFGEPIHVKGQVRAYAGYPVTSAKVTYKVIRHPHFRWWWANQQEETITSGQSYTQTDGSFSVTFTPERLKNNVGDQFYTYSLQATVTDQKGETREGEQRFSVGDKTLFVMTDMVEGTIIDKSKGKPIKVLVETINGVKRQAVVSYELYLLDEPADFVDAKQNDGRVRLVRPTALSMPQRKAGRLVRAGQIHTNDGPLNIDYSTMPSGTYQLVCTTKDDKEQTVSNINGFTLFAPGDKRSPEKAYLWIHEANTQFNADEAAVLYLGTAATDVYVLYQLVRGHKVLESRWLTLSNTLQTITIPYKNSYEDGVYAQFSMLKQEQLYTRTVRLTLKTEQRELTPSLTVFRDKLRPGETAAWSLTIPETKGNQHQAEVLATMYDASLDAIQPHAFYFSPIHRPIIPYSSSWNPLSLSKNYTNNQAEVHTLKGYKQRLFTIDWLFDQPNMWDVSTANMRIGSGSLSVAAIKGIQVSRVDQALQGRIAGLDIKNRSTVLQEHAVVVAEPGYASNEGVESPKAQTVVTPRRQFNETAFFYPHLRTDEDGNAVLSFTVPESLTRWNLNLLAHTKDLYAGLFKTQVETQKELMVQLNLPRFVRRSDKPVLSATVVNLSDSALTAEVTLELLNPADEMPLAAGLIKQPIQTVQLAAGETKALSWALDALTSFDLVVCKAVATTAVFSDGEQHYLPVLPDKELMTETLPLTVKVNQTKAYALDKLLSPAKGVTPHALTVEFSPNPSWMALLALPSMAEPTHDNAFDFFTAFYVSRLATHIVHSYPKLSAMFDQWRQSGNSRTALLSTLSKNQELKTLLLEETPWVMAAKDETEQRRQLALLFDLNQQKDQQRRYWDKLMALQQASGGFAWFEGMPESRYVTQYILLNQARLSNVVKPVAKTGVTAQSGYSQDIIVELPDPAILKALAYADKAIADDYEDLKKQRGVKLEAHHIGNIQWQYLHLRSCYPQVELPKASEEAVAYYTKQAEIYWRSATLYGKAATVLIAARRGNTTLAVDILTGLKEQALITEEMGMYWAHNKPGFFWYERPIGVQTMLLEAFAEVAPVANDLDAMKTWLLRQKQTQRWDTKLSTVDAIYALLHQGRDWFGSDNTVTIKLGNTVVPTDTKEAGTGYVKHRYEAQEVKPSMGKVTVGLKGQAGMGWGALYWQYFQDIDQVRAAGSGLSVSKQLFLEQTTPTGKVMVRFEDNANDRPSNTNEGSNDHAARSLKPGDKVITRLFVTVDRDMDFVVLKDQRAACFEPVEQRSGYVWREGVGYYQTAKDASTQFFFNHLPKGRYAFEYAVFVNNAGSFADGVATVQCLYAPEFTAHSSGGRLEVKP